MDNLIIGCGYLGRRIAPLWLGQGHRVLGTTRSAAQAAELRALGIEPVIYDVLGADNPLLRVNTVVYCVGLDRAAGRSMREVYVQGLDATLARLPRPDRFVYVSSTGVYGQANGEEVDETAATEPLEESGQVVLEAEQVLRRHCPEAIVLRLAGIYGPGRVRQQALAKGEPIVGDGDRWVNLIHVDDAATAVLAAEARGTPGAVYNICDDRPVRRHVFYERIAEWLHAPPPRFVPPQPGDPAPPRERHDRRILNRKMRTELGVPLAYPSYEEGLRAILGAGS